MPPFLASSVKIVKSDGTTTTVDSGSDEQPADSADETSNQSHSGVPSKHAKHSNLNGDTALAIPIVAIVFVFLWLIIKTLMAPFTQRNQSKPGRYAPPQAAPGGFTEEEIALLQKLGQTLAQMERRVESLETILIDQTRTKEKYGTKL